MMLSQLQSSESGTSTVTSAFERRDGISNSSSNWVDLRALCKAGRLKEVLHILNERGISADSTTCVSLLQECIKRKDLAAGKQVHAHIIQNEIRPNIFVLNTLVNMYAKCGSVGDARQVFDKMPERDRFTWNTMITGYAKHAGGREACKLYEQMQWDGLMPDRITFTCVLNACASLADLEKGKEIHAHIIKAGIVLDMILATALADMYAKCGSMNDAHEVFDSMAQRNVVSWNAMIAGYAQQQCGREAFEMYEQMQQEGVKPDRLTFIFVLNACARLGTLDKVKEVHADIMKAGIALDIILETALADMYAKCGSMKDAHEVFSNMVKRDVVSWNAMITGYAQHGRGREAFDIYDQMHREGVEPDRITFICVLNACASLRALEKGKEVHAEIIKSGIAPYVNLENTLIDMYAKCGSMSDAHQVFVNIAQRNVVSWNAMITGYAQHACDGGRDAFKMYEQMQQEGVMPDKVTFICILNVCAALGDLQKGKEVQADIIKAGIAPYINLENALVHMYAKCGSMKEACQVFNKMAKRDVVSWSTIITGYAQHGCSMEAFEMYEQMLQNGLTPDRVTFTCILHACGNLGVLEKGKEIHADIVKSGIVQDIILETSLVDMYAKCRSMKDACLVFNNMAQRPASSWSALIAGYAQHGFHGDAFKTYEEMIGEGVTPDRVTFICMLNVCASLGVLEQGKEVHAHMIKSGFAADIMLETALTDMYAKCGSIKDAREVFDNMAQRDVVAWSTMITGYGQHGCGGEAFKMYEQMILEGVTPDKVTFISVLNACASLGALDKGQKVHADINKTGIVRDIMVETALADMYAKCGSVKEARQVFDNMAQRDVVSWNAMIAGYAQHGFAMEAFEMYKQMIQEGVLPDKVTFIGVLNACASLAALEKGKKVHADIMQAGIAPDVILATALADMYAKCGSVEDARQVFDSMAQRNVVSWNAMIAGYGQHGCAREALQLFEQMQQEGLKPDDITFVCVLSACSHVGLVDEACHYFDSMCSDDCLTPTVEHFGCMVDLLGRAGQLDVAEELIDRMPVVPDAQVWGALLGACRIHGDVEVAERVAQLMLKWDTQRK